MASASCLLVFHSSTDVDYRQMICLVFAREGSCFAAVRGFERLALSHGLSAQQVSRKQRIDWGGAAHHSAVLGTGRPPQAGVLLYTPPQQLVARLAAGPRPARSSSASSETAAVPVADGVRGRRPSAPQPCLIGAGVGLPAGGGREGLTLCKEAVHLLFSSKLCQYSGVSQNTPGKNREWMTVMIVRLPST